MDYPEAPTMESAWVLTMSDTPPAAAREEEARLVAASVAGDEGAFAQLVRLHQHRVFRLSGRFFRRREDVEDAAQETFLTAWRRLASYRAAAPFEHWLTRVCLNCCYSRLGRMRKNEDSIEGLDVAAAGPEPDVSIEVDRLLRRLAPSDRFVLLLLDGEGWSVGEIADRLGWSATNVKVRAFRARRRLRRLLEGR
jgi:RNA polymerase sigma-70 factor (ECF subfamily)